jgi:hypothetical protein
MRSADHIVMVIHDPTRKDDPVPDVQVLSLLATEVPIVWADRTGLGRTLISEVDQRDIANHPLRKVS